MSKDLKNIIFERGEHTATITFNKPPLNVLDIKMMEEINSVLEESPSANIFIVSSFNSKITESAIISASEIP